jgi:hypothetical protein
MSSPSPCLHLTPHQHPPDKTRPPKDTPIALALLSSSLVLRVPNLPRPDHPQRNRCTNVHEAREEDRAGVASVVERNNFEADGFGD